MLGRIKVIGIVMYYLETNALYKVHKLILDRPGIVVESYTSFLSVLEILSGINESEYERRKVIITNLFRSKLPIDWETPRMKLSNAFEVIEVNDDRYIRTIKQLCRALIKATDYLSLKSLLKNNGTRSDFESLVSDDSILCDHSGAIEKKQQYMKNTERDKRKLVRNEWYDDNGDPKKSSIEEMKHWRIKRMAEVLISFIHGDDKIAEEVDYVKNTYNGTNDLYYLGDVFLNAERLFGGREVGKNDYIDISHLLYLRNNNLVSDDHIFDEMMGRYVDLKKISIQQYTEIAAQIN